MENTSHTSVVAKRDVLKTLLYKESRNKLRRLASSASETVAPSALSNIYFRRKKKYVRKLNNVHVV